MKKWTMSELRRSWKLAARLRNQRIYRPSVESLESRVTPANINITAFHYDPAIQGQDTQENSLSPLTVNQNNFGKLASLPVDGYTYAQPLYMHGLMIGGMPHDVAFVATEHDSLYAFDIVKNPTTGAVTLTQLWQRSFINPTAGITPVPQPDIISGDIVPEIGITGGGVIDPATNTLYLVAKTKEVRADGNHYVQKLYAIDITSTTGADKHAPYTIGDTHGSATFANETTTIMVPGIGAETSGGANPMVPFSALKENQRPSLQLLGGRVYVGWASHGDNGPYHGWVVGFNETSLQPEKIFCTSPNGGLSGIWQSEGAISTDGRYLYFAVGNGGGAGGFQAFDPAHGNYSESVLKLDTQPAGVMMPVADYFTPFNWQSLDNADADLGSGGVMLLPDSVGGNGHTHLMVETGKDGHIYLLDRDMMGQFHAGSNMIVQDVVAGPGGVWGNPAFYQESATSGLIFYHGSGSDSRVFRITGGQIQQVSGNFVAYRSNQNFGFPGANPVISANGVNSPSTAVIWEVQLDNYGSQGPATLHAYGLPNSQTGNLTELYNSNQAGARDRLSASVKFTSAVVTNGLVFVAQGGGPAAGNPASGTFNIFGQFAPPTHAPAAPTNLSATGLSSTQIQLNWINPPPTEGAQATANNIFRSVGDNQHYGTTPIATVSGSTATYTDTVSDPNQIYYYKVQASNVVGNSPFSNEASASPFVQPILSLVNAASNAVALSWTRPPVANNRYDVERSTTTDFASFTVVAAGLTTNMTSYTDTSSALVTNPGVYYYRIRAYSTSGTTPFALSNTIGVKVGPNAGKIEYGPPNGFPAPPAPSPFDLQANGSAQFAETTARLTNANNQTGSVFSAGERNILNWTTTFSVRLHEGTQPSYADGFTFTIQALGANALGQGQTGLGYQGITNSVALTFDTFTNGNPGAGSVGLFVNGDNPGGTPGTGETRIALPGNMVSLDSQSTKVITLSYAYNAGNPSMSVLHEVIVDMGPGQGMFTHDYTVNIPALLGIPTSGNTIGYVGFTGSTGAGGFWEIQDILNWIYTPTGPAAPNHLKVNSLATSNVLTWQTTSADDQGYYVERATNINGPYMRIASLPAGTTSYTDMNLMNPQQYYYRVQQFNHNGPGMTELDSGYSNVGTGAVVSINFTSFPNGSGFTTNTGNPPVRIFPGNPAVLRLTDGNNSEASSAWYNTVIGSGAFTTTFTLRDVPNGGAADSASFVIQNDPRGTGALGGGGGAGGYAGIINSMAIKFDLYTHGSHNSSTGLFTNGQAPDGFPAQDVIMGPTPIDLRTGHPMQITLVYDGGTRLDETVHDTVSGANFTHTYTMPMTLAQLLGGSTGIVGFTGATGGENATQDILSWTGSFAQAPPQVSRFVVSANPSSITAGQTTAITVTAMDQNGNVFTGYTGKVHFSSTDSQAGLPADYTFTPSDMGMHVFMGAMAVTLKTAGNQTVTVTDTAKNSVTGNVVVAVSPGAITKLSVTGFPAIISKGVPANFTVAASDAYGNTNPSYRGTVHLTSSDPAAVFTNGDGSGLTGNNYTFTATDNGAHMFRATLNTVGTQSITATDTVTMTITGSESGINVQQAGATVIDFSAGFANHGNLTANGSAAFPAGTTVLRLTDGGGSEAASTFYNTLVGTGAFNTTFTFQLHTPASSPPADGFAFVIQADPRGIHALGDGGGSLGYGREDGTNGPPQITPSIAIKFDMWKGYNTGDTFHSSTGLYFNGHRPNNPPNNQPGDLPVDLAGTGIDFARALAANPPHTFRVTLAYDGTMLMETIVDVTQAVTFMHSYPLNLTQVLGGQPAYVGFTGGTGGATATQDILTWTGSFQQAGQVNINFSNFANHSTLTANTAPQSPPVNVFPTTTVSPNFPNFNTHTGIVTNGTATFTGTPTVLRLTDGGTGQAGSAWYASPVLAGNFTTTFTLQDQPVNGAADSLSFVFQADPRGTAALGNGGGDGGYGSGTAGIINSFAIKFDLYNHGNHMPSTGLFTNGQSPAGFPNQDVPLTGINLGSNDPLQVTLTLNGSTLTEMVVDTVSHAMFSHTYTLNIGQLIGSGPAYVGFTAGTGGETAIQRITGWSGTFVGPTSAIQLTDNRGGEATSVFYNSPIGVGPFSTSFTLQDTPQDGADSLSFVIQADPRGVAALGGSGGAGGYGGITNSIAVKFDLWNHGNHAPYSTGLFTGGQAPDSDPSKDVSLAPIQLGSGHPLQVTFAYDGTTLSETVRDTVTGQTFSHNYPLNLAQVIGGNSAYVGFTAGTGGVASTQRILDWTGLFAPPQPTRFLVSAPSTIPAGTPFQVTVTAVDQNNNPLPGYRGTIHFSSSDQAAGLPANYNFTAADNSAHTFTVTLNTIGSQSITVVDTAMTSIAGTQAGINVTWDFTAGFANHASLQANGSAAFVGPVSAVVGIFTGHQDIGTPGNPGTVGNATFANGAYTLTASGSDIWDTADHFHYAYEALNGNGEIIARLVSANAPDFWTKAGLMIRTDLSAGSAYDMMMDTPNTGHQEPVMQWRDSPGNGSGDTGNHGTGQTPNVPVPIWLRLVRVGNTFYGYWATDNNGTPNTWQLLGNDPHNTTMPTTVYVGLALTAHNNGAVATATFDHVQVIGNTIAPVAPTVARLTDGGNGEAGAIFSKTKLPTGSFTTSFVLKDQAVNAGGADSLSFVLQNDPRGPAALGTGGGGGGYQGITNSIAVKFDLWTNNTHQPMTGLFFNGQAPASDNTGDVAVTGGLSFLSGHPIQVTLTYNGTTLTESLQDTVTGQTFSYDYLVNLAQYLGGTSAYAGFTAGTGGASAIQDIQSWTYQPTAVPAVASLSAVATLGANLVTNGGFETGNFNGWTLAGFGAGDDNIVTNVQAGSAEIHGGTHAAQFGPNAIGTITQNLATTPGVSYNLDFYLSNPIGGNGTEWLVKVGTTTLMDVKNAPRSNFIHYTFTFTATSNSTPLQFGFANPPDWFYLDDVTVTPANLTAGTPAQVTVTALDAGGHRVGYTGTVHITTTDPQIPDFGTYTFTQADNGQHVFTGTLVTAGVRSVTFTDVARNSLTATATATVIPAAASAVMVSGFPSPVTAGTAGTFTVSIKDAYGNLITGYRGTVHFTSTDPQAVLPADYTFTAADAGTHVFTATLKTAGTQSITATDTAMSSLTGMQSGITVNPAALSKLAVSVSAPTVTAGTPEMVTVIAQDAYGNTITNYGGTVHFTSSDPQAMLPANSMLTNGRGTFSATLLTAGSQTITATDTVNSAITGTATVTVNPAATAGFYVAGPGEVTAGDQFIVQVSAVDQYGNVTPNYSGTITFSSADPQAGLPADYTFSPSDNGQASFIVSLFTAGVQDVTVTDTVNTNLTGSAFVQVDAAQAVALVVSGFPSPTTAGTPGTFTVMAVDQYGNVAPTYTGTVTFFSSDMAATFADGDGTPLDNNSYTFTAADNGSHVFQATLYTAGSQVLGANDANDPTIAGGVQDGIVVVHAAVSALVVSGFPSPTTAGTPGTFTVTAVDAYGNVITDFTDQVAFYSSDSAAQFMPRSYHFTLADMGTATITATLNTPGTQLIGAIDVNNPDVVGEQDNIEVDASPSVSDGAGTQTLAHSLVVDQGSATIPVATGTVAVAATSEQQPPVVSTTVTNTILTTEVHDGLAARRAAVDLVLADWNGNLLPEEQL